MLMCYVLINGNCIGLHTVYQKFGVSKSFFMKEIPIFKIVKDHVTLKTWVMASDNIFKYNKIENQKIHNICFVG